MSPEGALDRVSSLLGDSDVYLIDQIQRGRVAPGCRVFDAGFGSGRNLAYFLRAGHPIAGIDQNPEALGAARERWPEFAASGALDRLQVGDLATHRGQGQNGFVILNAVLHFASSKDHFEAMLQGAWSELAPGGVLFIRLATRIGIEPVAGLQGGRYLLRDGSERFLVDRAEIQASSDRLGAVLVDPVKTTLVEDWRAMTTWVLGRTERP